MQSKVSDGVFAAHAHKMRTPPDALRPSRKRRASALNSRKLYITPRSSSASVSGRKGKSALNFTGSNAKASHPRKRRRRSNNLPSPQAGGWIGSQVPALQNATVALPSDTAEGRMVRRSLSEGNKTDAPISLGGFLTSIRDVLSRMEDNQKKCFDGIDKRLTSLEKQTASQEKRITNLHEYLSMKLTDFDKRMLAKHRVDTELINDSLCKAVKTRQCARVKKLMPLANPENLRIKTSYVEGDNEYTPLLMYAVSNNAYDIAKVLLEDSSGRINVNEKVQLAYDCETALLQAITNGSTKLVELLLQNGADPNLANMGGVTPLHRACYRGYTDIMCKLLRGIPMATKGKPYPCEKRKKDKLFKLLLGRPLEFTDYIWKIIVDMVIMPVDIFAKDKKGEMAVDFARNKNHVTCQKLLEHAMKGTTPLHWTSSDSDADALDFKELQPKIFK